MDIKEDLTLIDELIGAKKWQEALSFIESKKKTSTLSKTDFMHLGLIYFNLAEYDLGLATFEAQSWDNYNDCAWLRRMVIAPLIKAGHLIWASRLLELILKSHPKSVLDLMTLSSVLIRQNRREEGGAYLEKILTLDKNNYTVVAQLIQLRLQANNLNEAVKLAEQYEAAYSLNPRLLKMAFLALSRAEKFELCIKHIPKIDFSGHEIDLGALFTQIAFDAQDYPLAESLVNQLLQLGHQDARIYLVSARIKLRSENSESDAIGMLIKANEIDPENIQVNNLLGELLLKKGKYSEALKYLEKLTTLIPNNTHTRLLHARALKFSGNYNGAANEMLEVVKLQPNSTKWNRYASSALVQAGRNDEATHLFAEGLAIRNRKLPNTFETGLNQLEQEIETVNLPQARFDWLWQMINANGTLSEIERTAYEKEAKKTYLLDHYLLDWLECRPQQADEPMAFFEDLTEISALLSDKLTMGKGLILATAHVGCLYAGPLVLDLLGLPYKWIASTPNIPSLPYNNTLISTSVSTEAEVVRKIIKSLKHRDVVTIAVDGAMNPAAPRVNFAGQEVTYSDFAARMSFRTNTPAYFAVSLWEKESFCFKLESLPLPVAGEHLEEFCTRWAQCYFSLLQTFLMNNPSNARLSGGIWRHVK